jgi:hypothetical protein
VPGKPDAKGKVTKTELDWRKALRAQLEGMQQADGTWVNGKNGRWYEACRCCARATR